MPFRGVITSLPAEMTIHQPFIFPASLPLFFNRLYLPSLCLFFSLSFSSSNTQSAFSHISLPIYRSNNLLKKIIYIGHKNKPPPKKKIFFSSHSTIWQYLIISHLFAFVFCPSCTYFSLLTKLFPKFVLFLPFSFTFSHFLVPLVMIFPTLADIPIYPQGVEGGILSNICPYATVYIYFRKYTPTLILSI